MCCLTISFVRDVLSALFSVISQAVQTPFRSYLQEMLALVSRMQVLVITKKELVQLCFSLKPPDVYLIRTTIHTLWC